MRPTSFIRAAVPALLLLAVLPSSASAHEHRHVAGHDFTVGFAVEPAYEGEKNGVSLRVVDEGGEPVEGLEESLQVEVTHSDSGASRTTPLRAVFNDPGHYTAHLVPTSSGVYAFRFFGTIDGAEVDETFTSGEGFNSVEPVTAIQFPQELASGREMQSAVSGASTVAAEAEEAASAATTRANIALGIGALGVVVGIVGVALAMRPRRV